jgi:hypothetical protein
MDMLPQLPGQPEVLLASGVALEAIAAAASSRHDCKINLVGIAVLLFLQGSLLQTVLRKGSICTGQIDA